MQTCKAFCPFFDRTRVKLWENYLNVFYEEITTNWIHFPGLAHYLFHVVKLL